MEIHAPERASVDAEGRDPTIPSRVVRVGHRGRQRETLVVAKVTFDLRPGTSPVAASHERLALEASPYGALSNSLRRIQDVAPPKPRADVLVVGFAYAPESAHDAPYEARVRVGSVDKTLIIQPPSFLEKDGTVTIEVGPKETRLCHELAREDETTNPFGTDGLTPDDAGRIPLPRIEASTDAGSSEPVGVGPVPLVPDWELRALGRSPNGAVELSWDGDGRDVQVAPRDQQLDGPLPAGVAIELVNLHPSNPVVSTRLEAIRPVAHVPGMGSTALVADTLLIDTERCVCLVTYRASLGDAQVDPWVEPRIEITRSPSPGAMLVPQVTAEFDAVDLAEHTIDTPFARRVKPPGEETVELLRRDVTPAPPSAAAFPPASQPGLSMTGPFPAAAVSSPALSMTGPFPAAAPSPPVSSPHAAPPPSFSSRGPRIFDEPTYLARGDGGAASPRANVPISDGGAVEARSALQASNDAAGNLPRADVDASTRLKRVPREMAAPREPPETIELLWFATDLPSRLRSSGARHPRLAEAFPENTLSDGLATPALDHARDVRRALLFAKPAPAPQAEIPIRDADRRTGLYRTELQLVVGELVAAFDPRRLLEATIGTIETLLPNEKSLRAMLDAAKKLLESEWVTPPAIDLAAQNLREAASRARDPNASMVEGTIERLLLEKRAYRVRPVLGAEHVRFGWYDEGRPGVPIYLPSELRDRLPLYPRLRARAIVEVHPRQDAFESHPVALRLQAIGRRLDA